MKNILFICFVLFFSTSLFSQYETVVFDEEKKYFNQGQALPAETNFMITGETSEETKYIEILIYKAGKRKTPLYISTWKRPITNTATQYQIPINYKLKSDTDYDFVINTYRLPLPKEKSAMRGDILKALNEYLDAMFVASDNDFETVRCIRAIKRELDVIAIDKMRFNKNLYQGDFRGFSDLVGHKLRQIKKSDQELSDYLEMQDKEEKKDLKKKEERAIRKTKKIIIAERLIPEIKGVMDKELEEYMADDFLKFVETFEASNYPVEKTRNIVSVNVGYGGIYIDNDGSNLSTASAPFIGVSIPFANSTIAPSFFRNTSVSLGVFLQDFEEVDGVRYTGPFIEKPVYAALGYKAFQFIRLNAGISVVEETNLSLPHSNSEITVKPFVGISAEINLWAALGSRK